MVTTKSRPSRRGSRRSPDGASVSGRPTLRTIAQMAGLAVTTISRALNNAPELSEETRVRVQKIAADIGYVPDRTALRLKTGRTHVISLVLDPHDELLGFDQSMVSGLSAALRGTPYHLVVTPNHPTKSSIDPILYVLRNRAADGVIFSRTEPHDPRVRLLLDENFPFVSHGRTAFLTPHPYVDYDNFAFAGQAVRRLQQRGCRKLAIILPPDRLTFAGHLRAGFMQAVAETGLAWEILDGTNLDSPADDIRIATMARVARGDLPDGFICTGDTAALAIMAALTDSGIAIGRDVHLVVKQTSGAFSQVRPRVDTIFEDIALAGQQMAELLLRRIQGEPAEDLQILYHPEPWY